MSEIIPDYLIVENARLKKKAATADAVAEQKANFLATMSHELRTPMQSVFGLLELILLENPTQNIREMAEIAKSSAANMLGILDDILDLAKIDADKMELDIFEVPIRTLARGVVEALTVKIRNKPVLLFEEIDSSVPNVIAGDPKRLRQILINLTDNALKFTPSGSVRICVFVLQEQNKEKPDTFTLRFEIIDTGPGLDQKTQNKLFENFIQADSTTARKFGGTGLGLSISRKLVALMGGTIGVTSEIGKGSTFWFEIPTHEITSLNQSMELPDLRGISVLSVDDHPRAASEIVNSLRSMGAIMENCATCAEALTLVQRKPFDVCIIDQGLPDGFGIDLIRHLVDIRPNMGMIMYTVLNEKHLQNTLQTLGIKYLSKPAGRYGLGQAVLETAAKITTTEYIDQKKLLIVEDNPSVQDLLKRQLNTLGAQAHFVSSGEDALHALKAEKYHVIFTDLHMPEMDGYELVKKIREQEKLTGEHIPVIVITADIQMMERQVYLEHGFDECLLKPASLGHFRRLMIRWGLLDKNISHDFSQKNTITSSHIDMALVAERMGKFDAAAKELLLQFIEMSKPLIADLLQQLKERDTKKIIYLSHSLKGAAHSACAEKLANIAAKIQTSAEAGLIEKKYCDELDQEFAAVSEEIQKIANSYPDQ